MSERRRPPALSTLIVTSTVVWLLTLLSVLGAQAPVQMTTAERIEGARWWPTRPAASRADFVGAAECLRCHKSKESQPRTAMARTATPGTASEVLTKRRNLAFTEGSFVHEIKTDNSSSVYTVSDGKARATATLGWAFGVGKVGQTYILEREGKMYESRASYFAALDALDLTPTRATIAKPATVDAALGRPLSAAEAGRCFGCHMTAVSTRGPSAGNMVPGVTCEACHGPGRAHARAMQQDKDEEGLAAIVNPAPFSPVDSVDFCGACHATYWDVTLAGEKGLAALRSQPFRLQNSRCWGDGDRRITCVTCHNPHEPLERDVRVYDQRCLACHRIVADTPPAKRTTETADTMPAHAPSCKAGARDRCASCHMPKYEVPGMHFSFTDHLIRVVR